MPACVRSTTVAGRATGSDHRGTSSQRHERVAGHRRLAASARRRNVSRKNCEKQQYYQRRNRQARKSHTKTRIAATDRHGHRRRQDQILSPDDTQDTMTYAFQNHDLRQITAPKWRCPTTYISAHKMAIATGNSRIARTAEMPRKYAGRKETHKCPHAWFSSGVRFTNLRFLGPLQAAPKQPRFTVRDHIPLLPLPSLETSACDRKLDKLCLSRAQRAPRTQVP